MRGDIDGLAQGIFPQCRRRRARRRAGQPQRHGHTLGGLQEVQLGLGLEILASTRAVGRSCSLARSPAVEQSAEDVSETRVLPTGPAAEQVVDVETTSAGVESAAALRDQIAAMGYDYNRSAAGLSQVRTQEDPYRRLGQLYGVQTSTDELVQETFGLGGGAEATTKKRKLASRERAAFGGSSALGQSSLAANRIGQV